MKRLENCLEEYQKIEDRVIRYRFSISELEYIIEKAQNKDPKTNFDLIFDIILITFKIAFVLGRRSVKNEMKRGK